MTHICVSKVIITGFDNGFSPGRRQDFIWINAGRLLISSLRSKLLWYIGWNSYVIRTLHDCPSQMNENLLISNSKLTSDSELIWWRQSTNLSSFVRDSHVGCVLYNGKDNHYQIRSWIQIMRNVRVLSNHKRALLAHPCTFGEKIARFGKSRFQVIIVLHQSQMITEIIEFTSYESFSIIQSLPQCQNNSVSMIK